MVRVEVKLAARVRLIVDLVRDDWVLTAGYQLLGGAGDFGRWRECFFFLLVGEVFPWRSFSRRSSVGRFALIFSLTTFIPVF